MIDKIIQTHFHNWDIKNIRNAKKIYYSTSSILNKKQLQEHLQICAESQDPKERHHRVLLFFEKVLEEDFLNLFCSMLTSIDVSIGCTCKFNLYDLSIDPQTNKICKQELTERKKRFERMKPLSFKLWELYSFYNDYEIVKDTQNKWDARISNEYEDVVRDIVEPNIFIDPYLYNYELLSKTLEKNYDSNIKIQILEKVGAEALHIYSIRDSFLLDTEFSERAKRIIAERYSRNETDREYWLYYVLIELYKQKKKIKITMTAIREIAKLFFKSTNSIKGRYYEKVDEAKELTLEEIMTKELLFNDVKKYLKKLNI